MLYKTSVTLNINIIMVPYVHSCTNLKGNKKFLKQKMRKIIAKQTSQQRCGKTSRTVNMMQDYLLSADSFRRFPAEKL